MVRLSALALVALASGVWGEDEPDDFDPAEALKAGRARMQNLDFQRIFPKVDTDGSGAIDKGEMAAFLGAGHEQIFRNEVSSVLPEVRAAMNAEFSVLDADRDGFLTRKEINIAADPQDAAAAAAAAESGTARRAKHAAENTKHVLDAWHFADSDRDDRLSPHEYLAFHHPELSVEEGGFQRMERANALREMDGDGDGFLSLKEFRRARRERYDASWEHAHGEGEEGDAEEERIRSSQLRTQELRELRKLLQTEERLFHGSDKNNDGQLTAQEFGTLWGVLSGQDQSEEARDMVKVCDRGGDGAVDLDELRNCLGEASTHLQDIFLAHEELRVR